MNNFGRRFLTTATRVPMLAWYLGASIGLVWMAEFVGDLQVASRHGASDEFIGWGITYLVVFSLLFLAAPVLSITVPTWQGLIGPLILLALSLVGFYFFGPAACNLWIYVTVATAFIVQSYKIVAVMTGLLVALGFAIQLLTHQPQPWIQPVIIFSMAAMMFGMASNIRAVRKLKDTEYALAALAVREERHRVARDMHDILGHSLSAITLKAELAGAMIERDPQRAAREINEVADLAHTSLNDMRTVGVSRSQAGSGARRGQAIA